MDYKYHAHRVVEETIKKLSVESRNISTTQPAAQADGQGDECES